MSDTSDESYARRLEAKEGARWKQLLDVQAPYRWNLRRQGLGRTLDVGCGIGRNLLALPPGSVGIDHNQTSVELARARGLTALSVEEWRESELRVPGAFEAMLVAHVQEHLPRDEGRALLAEYLPYVRPGGLVFLVCPQERGYASDSTHVRFLDGPDLEEEARAVGLVPEPWSSFPFPRRLGRVFTYNELCVRARVPAT